MLPLYLQVELTYKDIRSYLVERFCRRPLTWVLSAITAFLLIIIILGIIISFPLRVDILQTPFFVMSLVLFTVIILFFIINSVIFFLEYLSKRFHMRRSALLREPTYYSLEEDGFKIHFSGNCIQYFWYDVVLVEEYKACFVIWFSLGKYVMIPRRCFRNLADCQRFINLLNRTIPEKRRKLVGYQIAWDAFPSHSADILPELKDLEEIAAESDPPLMKIKVLLTVEDSVSYMYQKYFSGLGWIWQLLAVTLFVGLIVAVRFLGEQISPRLEPVILIFGILGLILSIIPVILLGPESKRTLSLDRMMKEPTIYRFYQEYFMIQSAYLSAAFHWNELNGAKENRDFFVFLSGGNIAHVIPKRILSTEELAEFTELFGRVQAVLRGEEVSLPGLI